MSGLRVVSVVGARPQFVKVGAMVGALSGPDFEHSLIHTGQHYDAAMSATFFDDLEIPQPLVDLQVGSGSHGWQTGEILARIEPVLDRVRPDWVLVYGDTNSTIAAALAAVKLGLPLAHLEAGLRSFNRQMPEEHNRVLTDHAADLCLAPTELAMQNLSAEGLAPRSQLVGDVMADVCLRVRDKVLELGYKPTGVVPEEAFVLATIHRPSNTDDLRRLNRILEALARIPLPVVLPAHPRLVSMASALGVELARPGIRVCEPLAYPALIATVTGAAAVVTDSGGLQKEAYLLGTPCTTVREETEWPETLEGGWNVLAPDPGEIPAAVTRSSPLRERGQPYGDGNAAARVAQVLKEWH